MVRVKHMLLIASVIDVLAYHGFIAMLSDRACEKTIRPKFAVPQLFLSLRITPEYPSRRHALQLVFPALLVRGRRRF